MIALDTNLLVYAHWSTAPRHRSGQGAVAPRQQVRARLGAQPAGGGGVLERRDAPDGLRPPIYGRRGAALHRRAAGRRRRNLDARRRVRPAVDAAGGRSVRSRTTDLRLADRLDGVPKRAPPSSGLPTAASRPFPDCRSYIPSTTNRRHSGRARATSSTSALAPVRDGDVLPAFVEVGHRRGGGVAVQLDLAQQVAGPLVEYVDELAAGVRIAPRVPHRHDGRLAGAAVAFPDRGEYQRLRHQHALAVDVVAERRQVHVAQQRVVARAVAERTHPQVLAAVHVDWR